MTNNDLWRNIDKEETSINAVLDESQLSLNSQQKQSATTSSAVTTRYSNNIVVSSPREVKSVENIFVSFDPDRTLRKRGKLDWLTPMWAMFFTMFLFSGAWNLGVRYIQDANNIVLHWSWGFLYFLVMFVLLGLMFFADERSWSWTKALNKNTSRPPAFNTGQESNKFVVETLSHKKMSVRKGFSKLLASKLSQPCLEVNDLRLWLNSVKTIMESSEKVDFEKLNGDTKQMVIESAKRYNESGIEKRVDKP